MTAMHAFATAALALLLPMSIAAPVRAQAPVPAGFVDAAAVVDGLVVDMRYFGDQQFRRREDRRLRAPALPVVDAQRRGAGRASSAISAARGLGLKVFDCYRPVRAVAHFIRWARRIEDLKRKAEYYPDIDKRDLFRLGYIAARSGHSRGSTVDLTLVRRADNAELDMGTLYDFSGRQSWVADKSVSVEAQRNRALFAAAMVRGGLSALPQGVVALHARERAVPGYVFRFSGAVSSP